MMRSLEVCAGIGGLTLGLEMAGFTCAGLVEIDPRCRAHLREKWPHVPVFADMRAITDDDLRAVGPVDLLAGGIPCQPHSVAGKRLGHEDERDLWPDFLALGLRLGAKALLVENVRGLASSPGGLDRIARDLEASGYCWWACSLRAADVGAPHLRDRLFICAIRMGDAEGIGSPAGAGQRGIRYGADQPQRSELACELADADGRDPGAERQPSGREQRQLPPHGRALPLAEPECGPAQRRGELGELRGSPGDAQGPGDQRQWGRDAAAGDGASGDVAHRDSDGLGGLGPPWASSELAPGHDPDGCRGTGVGQADTSGPGPQGGWWPAAGLQRATTERGGEVGDAEVGGRGLPCRLDDRSESGKSERTDRGSGPGPEALGDAADRGRRSAADAEAEGRREGPGRPGHDQGRQLACGPEGRSPWSDVRPIHCRDGKRRLVPAEPALFPVAHGSPGRVARLRALGNAVVPLQAYVPARALYEVMVGGLDGRAAA